MSIVKHHKKVSIYISALNLQYQKLLTHIFIFHS